MALEFSGPAAKLTSADIAAAAESCSLEPTLIQAVVSVEAGSRGGFLPDGRPIILFEAQHFDELTRGRFRDSHPSISSATWNRGLYSRTTVGEYERLDEAITLDRDAALKSASWGLFQIMGSNAPSCGCTTVEAFVQLMVASEAEHLKAFLNFIHHERIDQFLRGHEWASFARRYNGAGYAANRYDTKLEQAYERACAAAASSPTPTGEVSVYITTSDVNVRKGPGVSYLPVAGSPLRRGTRVTVLQSAQGWSQIHSDVAEGWMNRSYLRAA